MNTRTVTLRLPDNPAAVANDFLSTLASSVDELQADGDYWSASIVATLLSHLRTLPVVPPSVPLNITL